MNRTGARGLLRFAAALTNASDSFGIMPPLLARLWLGLDEGSPGMVKFFLKGGISSVAK